MGFKVDITAYQKMQREYDARGARMRAARYVDIYPDKYLGDSLKKEPSEGARSTYRSYDNEGRGWSYACEPLGCSGQGPCGH